MAIQNIWLNCIGTPDDAAMKAQLSAIPGIVEMNIDSRTHSVEVRYEDTRTSGARIAESLDVPGYRLGN